MPAICSVYGKVLDSKTNKPTAYATVSIFSVRKDSLVGGDLVQGNGDFKVSKLRFGKYQVKINFLGYAEHIEDVMFTRNRTSIDLGNIKLMADDELLKTVEIVAEKQQAVLQVDRKVYNVDKDLSVRGGTAEDVMENIPGLDVDSEGNVELRGRSPRIFVDGRPSLLTLEQIPADEIERVEVITNPSVLFEASSTGGILNVVLKKTTRAGYSGSVQAGIGTNERYSTRGDLWVKETKYSLNLNLGYSIRNRPTNGFTERKDFVNGEVVSGFDQNSENESNSNRINGRFGFTYNIDNRNEISLNGGLYSGEYDTDMLQTSDVTDGAGTVLSRGIRNSDQVNDYTSMNSRLSFKRKSPEEGKYWTTDFTYSRLDRNTYSRFIDSASDLSGPLDSEYNVQTSIGGTENDQLTWQLDFVDPFADNKKIEWGLRSNFKNENSVLRTSNQDITGTVVNDTSLSNVYDVVDIVNGIYFNYSTRLTEKWTMQAGLRAEQTWFEADLPEKNQTFEYKYPDGLDDIEKALFPAIYFSHKWNEERELQVNFSRKIDRPNFWQVMPFIFTSDQRSIRIGNPTLAPEFSNLAEVNHLLPFGKRNNWLTSLYTRITEDVITSYAYTSPSDPDILVSSFTNGETSHSFGWENTLRVKPSKKLDLTLSGNLQYIDISLRNGDELIENRGVNWRAKANVKYSLPKDFAFQLNGRLNGPRIIPQGERQAQYVLDVTLNKKIKRKWEFNLRLRDAFNSRYWWTIYDTPTFYQETQRRRDTRHLMLTITYRFGQQDASLFRRRGNSNQRSEPGKDDSGGEGF